ncbi:MAG TPA: HlyD family efflux transporter periplasmic adaptor subunit [Thermoanaerobaculia bacterium]
MSATSATSAKTAARGRGRLRWGIVAALLAGAALWWSAGRASGERESWGEVRRADLVLGVDVRGTLAAVDSAALGPPAIPDQWSQKISYLAPEGRAVRKGTPVLRFDSTELAKKLVDRLAEQESAEQELEKKRADLERGRLDDALHLEEARAKERKAALKVDVPPELVAASQLRQSRTDLALARQEIAYLTSKLGFARREGAAELGALVEKRDRAAARVAEIRGQIASLSVAAPRDGVVVYVADHRGDKKKVGDSAYQGEKVIEIPDLRRMRADAEIDEADLARVAVGQAVTLRLDSHPDEPIEGRVATIRGAVTARSDADRQKVVEAELALDHTDPLRMRPGMRFRGTIEVARVPGALVAPADAVTATAEGPAVLRATAFGHEVVHPRLGRHNDRLVEVLSGLAPGDRVARAGADAGDAGSASGPAAGSATGSTMRSGG